MNTQKDGHSKMNTTQDKYKFEQVGLKPTTSHVIGDALPTELPRQLS